MSANRTLVNGIQRHVAQAADKAGTGWYPSPSGAGIMTDECTVLVQASETSPADYEVKLFVPSGFGRTGGEHVYATLHAGLTPEGVAVATIVATIEHAREVDSMINEHVRVAGSVR